MAQILDGYTRINTPESYSPLVGQWRTSTGNWNFTDDTGAQGAYTIFTVTGTVLVRITGVCNVTLTSAGAPTIELGIAGNTASIIAQTAGLDLDQYESWQDAGPEPNPGAIILMTSTYMVAGGTDVIFTIGTADLTAGDVDFMCMWIPVTVDGYVVAA